MDGESVFRRKVLARETLELSAGLNWNAFKTCTRASIMHFVATPLNFPRKLNLQSRSGEEASMPGQTRYGGDGR